MTDDKKTFVYLDPPYEIKSNLYGKKGNMHKGFDHDDFYYTCDRYVCDQMVSYNSSNLIKSRFIDWKPYDTIILTPCDQSVNTCKTNKNVKNSCS